MAALSFLGALPPDEAQEALSQRALALEFRLAQNRGGQQAAAAAGLARLFLLESEYEDRLLEAELDFLKALIKDIEDGSLDGIDLWRSFESESTDNAGGDVMKADET